jgi:hypothetical protein
MSVQLVLPGAAFFSVHLNACVSVDPSSAKPDEYDRTL